jgi:hypothetical protein
VSSARLTHFRTPCSAALLVAAVELDLQLITPAAAPADAWSAVPPPDRALLSLLLESPRIHIESLDAPTAAEAGTHAHDAHRVRGTYDAGSAHTVDAAVRHGYPILTNAPTPLRAIDPSVAIEQLPGD